MALIKTARRQNGMWIVGLLGLLVLVGPLGGCPSAAPTETSPSASATQPPLWVPPPREGCLRNGALEAIETDPACVVARADESVTREAMKQLVVELKPDVPAIVGGGTVLLRLTITNRGASEAELVFATQPASATARPDWTRLAGVPELQPTPADGYRLVMPLRTLDAHERSVDGLPTTPQVPASVRLLRVRLRPGARLSHTFAWWALRIPAPMPIFYDDAGHRFVPKTAPLPLTAGEYGIAVDLPLYGVTPAESIAATRIQVDKIEKLGRPDGGAAAAH